MPSITTQDDSILADIGFDPSTIKSIRPIQKRTHYRAAMNFLTQSYCSESDRIQGYIEACYHFRAVEDYEKAEKLLLIIDNIHSDK